MAFPPLPLLPSPSPPLPTTTTNDDERPRGSILDPRIEIPYLSFLRSAARLYSSASSSSHFPLPILSLLPFRLLAFP